MSEAAFGVLEAAFAIVGLMFIAVVWFVAFRPSARQRMRDHAMIPFRDRADSGGPDGEA